MSLFSRHPPQSQYFTFLNNVSFCPSLRLLKGFMCHCFKFILPRKTSTLLAFWPFKPPFSNKVLTSWNSFQTSLPTLAMAKTSLRAFFCKCRSYVLIILQGDQYNAPMCSLIFNFIVFVTNSMESVCRFI